MTRAPLVAFATAALLTSGCGDSTPAVAADAGAESADAAVDCATAACAADASRDSGGAPDATAGTDASRDDGGGGGGGAAGCTGSGGTVGTGLCCAGISDFPNACAIGACSCAPSASHQVAVCACARNECFDGTRCVAH